MDIGSVAIGNVFSINGEEFLKVRPLPQFPYNVTAVKLATGELIVYPSSSTLCRTPEDDAIDAVIIERKEDENVKEESKDTSEVRDDSIRPDDGEETTVRNEDSADNVGTLSSDKAK